MSFVRDIYYDLVDKRLWPIAAVLVVAALAIPVALAKSGPSEEAASVTPTPTSAGPAAAVPVSVGSGARPRGVLGTPRDPFVQQHVAPAPQSGSSLSTSIPSLTTNPASVGPALGDSGSTGSAGGSSSGGSTGSLSPKPNVTPESKIEVRFGLASGKLKTYSVGALSPLPNASDPILIFTGLLKDGKTAAFLVSSDATAQGDGRCSPSASICSTILMKPGDTEFLDVATGNGTAQYQLEMRKVVSK